jgi:arylsulfatase A-like enzyme
VPCIGGHAHAYFGKGQGGFEQGFTDWRLVPGITFDYQTDPYVTSDKLTPLAIEMLSAVATDDRPFFAWFHYMDPHDEYKPHDGGPRFGKRPRDVYDEEVFFTDTWIGKLLDFVEGQPWAARTVIAVTADHGEAFGEHGMLKHAHELWEELVHVPLFFYVPGHAPRTLSEPRSHVDLAPTFGDIVGVNLQRPLAVSLVPELEGATPAARDVIADLPEDDINERRRALIHGTTKLISFKDDLWFKLFDLDEDPGEQHDLWKKQPELAADMLKRYREASRAIHDLPPPGGIPRHDD